MCGLETYQIDLKNLKADNETFEFAIDDEFFHAVEGQDVKRGAVNATVSVSRKPGFFLLDISVQGSVKIPCDICLDDMDQPVAATNRLTVKFGDAYSEEDDTVTIDEREGFIDISWFIYEMIVLAIPIKHVHTPGKCNPAMMKVLEEHSAARSSSGEAEVDPRWSELEKLKTILKD